MNPALAHKPEIRSLAETDLSGAPQHVVACSSTVIASSDALIDATSTGAGRHDHQASCPHTYPRSVVEPVGEHVIRQRRRDRDARIDSGRGGDRCD